MLSDLQAKSDTEAHFMRRGENFNTYMAHLHTGHTFYAHHVTIYMQIEFSVFNTLIERANIRRVTFYGTQTTYGLGT